MNHITLLFKPQPKKAETLAEYVRRVRTEKGFSLRDVQDRSGNLTTIEYVSKIESGWVLNITPTKLAGIAKGLGITEKEIFKAAKENGLGNLISDSYLESQRIRAKQRKIILIGILVIGLMLLIPPWKFFRGGTGSSAGYGFLFDPSNRFNVDISSWPPFSSSYGSYVEIDVSRLLAQCSLVAVLVGGILILIRRPSLNIDLQNVDAHTVNNQTRMSEAKAKTSMPDFASSIPTSSLVERIPRGRALTLAEQALLAELFERRLQALEGHRDILEERVSMGHHYNKQDVSVFTDEINKSIDEIYAIQGLLNELGQDHQLQAQNMQSVDQMKMLQAREKALVKQIATARANLESGKEDNCPQSGKITSPTIEALEKELQSLRSQIKPDTRVSELLAQRAKSLR